MVPPSGARDRGGRRSIRRANPFLRGMEFEVQLPGSAQTRSDKPSVQGGPRTGPAGGQSRDYKDDLYDLLFPDVGLLDPRTGYLRALLELFEDELEQDETHPESVNLAPFQEDGFRRALSIVNRHRGVVYADGVGTGKTEIGMAFVEEYAVRRGQHALGVVPAQLVDQWKSRLDQTRLPAQVISYHGFASDEQLANPEVVNRRRVLSNDKDAYRLVILDEAHALRSPGTTWYGAMSRLLGGQEKDLLLLTATPINNGLWDLYHMVMAFAHHD